MLWPSRQTGMTFDPQRSRKTFQRFHFIPAEFIGEVFSEVQEEEAVC